MSSPKDKSKPKSSKQEKDSENKNLVNTSLYFFNEILKTVHIETVSSAGRVNLVVDFGLLIICIVYLLTNTATSVARIIASIFNPSLTGQTGDNIIILVLIFVVASMLCLIFMHITRKEKEYYNQHTEDESKES